MRSIAQNAQLALLLEVTSTPKPGNVDREREYADLRFEHFVTGAVGAYDGLAIAGDGGAIGNAFERSIAGMSNQGGGNTQFGAILLVTPLAVAAAREELTREGTHRVVEETTVEDAVNFYRAFDHVSVAVDDPPDDLEVPDVRRGSDAAPAVREDDLTLGDVMAASESVDGLAAEWTAGFPRTFDAAQELLNREGTVSDRAAAVYLELLADEIDTFVVTQHDQETAEEVKRRAQEVLDGNENVRSLAAELVKRDINPGTTADIIAGALFVALERGLEI